MDREDWNQLTGSVRQNVVETVKKQVLATGMWTKEQLEAMEERGEGELLLCWLQAGGQLVRGMVVDLT